MAHSEMDYDRSVSVSYKHERKPISILGWIILFGIVAGSSTIGVFPNLWLAKDSSVKNIWRYQMSLLFVIPLVVYYSFIHWKSVKALFKLRPLAYTYLNSLFLAFTSFTFIKSSEITLISHSVCIGQAAGVVLIGT